MLKLLAARLRLWWREYDIAFRLDGVDDRILADMGIERRHIPAFAHQAARPAADAGGPVAARAAAPASRRAAHEECGIAA